VTLSWQASTDNVGVAGYGVYRDGLLAGTTSATSFTNSNLVSNTSYVFTVAAFDAAGNSSLQSAPRSVTTAATLTAGYTTSFTATENPISENANWISPAADIWNTRVRTAGGVAFGDPQSAGVNDSVAFLTGTGYLKNQTVTATVYKAGDAGSAELEIHLRGSFDGTQIFSYEIDIFNGIVPVKWYGTQGTYLILPYTFGNGHLAPGTNDVPEDGDIFTASIVGDANQSTISVYQTVGGVGSPILIMQAQDSAAISGSAPFVTGNPGIGFDVGAGGTWNLVGWKEFSVDTY
jgi:chitodextrinase